MTGLSGSHKAKARPVADLPAIIVTGITGTRPAENLMLKYVRIAFLAFIAVHPAVAADSKPTEESVKQLLDVTGTRNLLDAAKGQIDSAMQASMKQMLAGQQPTRINGRFWMT
jgi:hypothetical protein